MNRILITGGAGFIGSNFVFHLLETHPDCQIICVDNLTYAGNLATLNRAFQFPQFRFYREDICNYSAMERIFREEQPETVVNFAAESHVDRSIVNPRTFFETNTIGTGVLLDLCRQFPIFRYHQVSTDEVYGDLPLEDKSSRFDESSPVNPHNPYSISKMAADQLVLAYGRMYAIPVSISRCSNNYGPFQNPEKLIPLLITRALHGKTLPIYGNGRNIRDWVFVIDHCRAIVSIIERGKSQQVYNIGGDCELSNIEVAEMLCDNLQIDRSSIVFVRDRVGHDLRYAMNYSKLTAETGWLPSASFAAGLKITCEWYKNNRDWWYKATEN